MAQSISLVGDQVSLLALPLVAVLTLHAGPAEMGYLVAANLVPSLLFSLHAGVWADRRGDRRGLMIATDVGRAALLATIPVAAVLGVLSMTQMYVVAFLVGSLTVLFWVSYNALFVVLVPREQFITGSSLLNGSRAVSFMAGPAIGGLLVQALTAPLAVGVDALSFVASALFMRGIDSPEPEPDPDAGSGGVMAGLRFIARDPIMCASLGATATINLFNFMFFALWILFATKTLHVSAGALGLVIGAGAVGSVIGSVVTGAVQRRVGVGPTFAIGCVLFPAPLMLVPAAGGGRPLVLAHAVPGRVLQRLGRDDARHHGRGDLGGAGACRAALTGRGVIHGGELRRAPDRLAGRRPDRRIAGAAAGRVGGHHRRRRRRAVAAALADHAAARAAPAGRAAGRLDD